MVYSKPIRGSVCLGRKYLLASLFLLAGMFSMHCLKAQTGGTIITVVDIQFKFSPGSEENIEISPNPASDHISIKPHPNVEVSTIEIFGSDGILVFSRPIQNGDVFTVDLAIGLYYFKIYTDNEVYTKTIIMQ